jgi:hypothetical protein
LKCKCLKWAHMTRLDICNTSYGKKKGWESNWQFDSQPQKVLPCVQVTCDTPLESSSQELQLCFRPRLDQRSEHGAMASQSCENPTPAVSRPLWESREKKGHLDVGLTESCKKYYMGEGGGFPRVQAVGSLVSLRLPVACSSTKGAQNIVLTNSWLVGCKFM